MLRSVTLLMSLVECMALCDLSALSKARRVFLLALNSTRNLPVGEKTTAMLTGKNSMLFKHIYRTNTMKVYHTLLPTSLVLVFSCLQPRLCLAAANRSHPFLLHQVQAHTVVLEPATRTHSTTPLRPQV